jgi:two-component system, NtrC family, nitrogen regulation response regulator GlnG
MTSVDTTTTRGPGAGPASDTRAEPGRSLALTIEWHPHVDRVGETAVLEGLSREGDAVGVTRRFPLFAPRGTQQTTPLAYERLSRDTPAFSIVAARDGCAELRAGSGPWPTEVFGQALERSMIVTPEDIDGGVPILVARRIVLCLHRVTPSIKRGPNLGLVGVSDVMEEIRQKILQIAPLDLTVLIRGETGTGKEEVAKAIVANSPRASKPFITVNMGGIPPELAAAELFGHERGAFTGAATAREGYFGAAAGGTLFLDEIGAALMRIQQNLFRALENREIIPVGANRARRVDVRILAATDADLQGQVADKEFSLAILQRLGTGIDLPPLRERAQDIGPLLLHFLRPALQETMEPWRLDPPKGDESLWLSAADVATMMMGTWPGNVRGLRNAVRDLTVFGRGKPRAEIGKKASEQIGELRHRRQPAGAAPQAAAASGSGPRPHVRRAIPDEELLRVYEQCEGNITKAAATLNVPRSTFHRLLERHPGIRNANAVPKADLIRRYLSCAGDVDRLAAELGVNRRGLKLRLTQLERDGELPALRKK